jgi:acyl carrier protein
VALLIRSTVFEVLDGESIDDDTPLMDSGIDSLSAVAFRSRLGSVVGTSFPASFIFDYPTIRAIAEDISRTQQQQSAPSAWTQLPARTER